MKATLGQNRCTKAGCAIAARPIGKLGIVATAAIVDKGRLGAAFGRQVPVYQINSCVVRRNALSILDPPP